MTLAVIFALLAATGWGVSAIFARLGLQHMRSNSGTVISLAASAPIMGLMALAVYGVDAFNFPLMALLWVFVIGVLNFPMGRLLNFSGVQLAGVGRSGPIMATAPLVSVSLGLLLGGESFNLLIAAGTAAIVGGVVLIVMQRS